MAFVDYYKIMGIPKDTPQSEIRKAYIKRTKQFHPDLHPDDPKAKAKFQALNEANAVLSDPEKRKKYDEYGEHWKEADAFNGAAGAGYGSYGGGAGGYSSDGGGFDFSQFNGGSGFSSFFEDLFGHHGGAGRGTGGFHVHFGGGNEDYEQPDYDKQATVTIDMYTALLGGEIMIQIDGGTYKLKVNPYTQNGSKVRMRGKGYPKGDGTNGDLILTYKVDLPKNLSERQKQLLREMQSA